MTTRHRQPPPAKKTAPMCAKVGVPDVDGLYSLLLSLVKLTERDARRGDPEAREWLVELMPDRYVNIVQTSLKDCTNHRP